MMTETVKDLSIAVDDPRCCVLGDSIVLASIFAHYGRVRWHTNHIGTMAKLLPYVEHMFELEIVPGWRAEYAMPKFGNMAAFALNEEIPLINIDLGFNREDYYSIHSVSQNPAREREHKPFIDMSKYVPEGKNTVDLNNTANGSFHNLVETLGKAQHHVGISSGPSWLAAALGTPVTFIMHQNIGADKIWADYFEASTNNEVLR